jgi:thymidylate synthase ThyX
MRVVIAGYNIDAQVLREALEAGVPGERLTPEVIAAAYARISRDPRPVGELRREALDQVEKARKSNRKIIFGMGHHSVAEHAVFNFDLLGVSRLAIEALEHFRLCSFTEKSQRYITLDHDFVLPAELHGTPSETRLCDLVGEQASLYARLFQALRARLDGIHPALNENRAGKNLLDGWAKEDARYVTLLATSGQLGFTANARNLEHIVRRLAAEPSEELRELGRCLYRAGMEVAPSLLLFTERSAFDAETDGELRAMAGEILGGTEPVADPPRSVRIVDATPDADRRVGAAMLARASRRSFEDCLAAAGRMGQEQLARLFEASMRRMEFYDAPRREFEHVTVTFELVVSAACYAQLKRHRMSTQTARPYDPALGLTVPPAIAECGMEQDLRDFAGRAEDLYETLGRSIPVAAPYALTNAHRRRVLMTVNLRELYHFSRLREDLHAQWDIRDLACAMREAVGRVMPLGALLLCGKDRYVERFESVFGRPPALDPAALG